MNETGIKALVSIHDVMPETLPQVDGVLQRLKIFGLPPITLLVVPGRDWQESQVEWLRQRVEEGHTLAAHGWVHETQPRTLYHRLHSALISRNVAEHLALDPEEIPGFISRSMGWFVENKLPVPILYVPPAWALGDPPPITTDDPFPRYIEVLKGIIDTQAGRLHASPMVGYEVDTWWRKVAVKAWNGWNISRARRSGSVLRIGLHPHDFELLLSADLEHLLQLPNLTPVDLEASFPV
ncbi:MAG: polysaccharide deacetylase family protein [Puniceicoccaceae bacterium]